MKQNEPPSPIERLRAARLPAALLLICAILGATALIFGQSTLAVLCIGAALAVAGFTDWNSLAVHHDIGTATSGEAAKGAREANEIFRAVVGVLDHPAFALDGRDYVLAYNQAARELFPGLDEGQELHRVSRNPGLLDALQRAREAGLAQSGVISERAPTGRRLLANVAPVPKSSGANGKAIMLIQIRDLSEQDRLTQLRTDFIANASHELRTPLASIRGFIETLQGPASADAPAQRKFLGIMATQAARMTRILDDLLSLSRIEMREHLPPSEIIDLTPVLKSTVEGLEPIAREAKISLKFRSLEAPNTVRGDRDELVQVFQNLIQNAIKYGHEGGNVEISLKHVPSVREGASKIAIAIADDGPGIAAAHLPRLTERFYRVDTATSRERGGTGLGLAIVKHIVSRHRGELKISSVPGEGSTFTVVLDSAAMRPDAGPAPGSPAPQADLLIDIM